MMAFGLMLRRRLGWRAAAVRAAAAGACCSLTWMTCNSIIRSCANLPGPPRSSVYTWNPTSTVDQLWRATPRGQIDFFMHRGIHGEYGCWAAVEQKIHLSRGL